MRVSIKTLSGDVFNIKVDSACNSYALGDEVIESVAKELKVEYRQIVLFQNGEIVDWKDEIDTGSFLEVFVN